MPLIMRHNIVSAPPPPSFVWPDATNTGVQPGITLTTYTGNYTITASGTTIENKRLNDWLDIKNGATNITIRNCEWTGGAPWAIRCNEAGPNILIEYCTIRGGSGIRGTGVALRGTIRNCKITNYENGIVLEDGTNLTVTGNYVADLYNPTEAHPDGIAMHGGQNGVLVENNHVVACGTSAIYVKADFAACQNVTVNHNKCHNMAGEVYVAAIFEDGDTQYGPNIGVRITNNIVERGSVGHLGYGVGTVVSGNTDYVTGAPVS